MSTLGPYLLTSFLFLVVAALAALDASLTHFTLLPWFNGLRWLRVHFITLGILTEMVFGAMPLVVAAQRGLPRPALRWDIWLSLNAGLVVLIAGIPLVNQSLILTGGTLVFIAATLLGIQLARMPLGRAPAIRGDEANASRPFYVMGLAYLLLGIIVGTGLWLGWNEPLRIQIPVEVHIHANNWGFMSLVFAGLLVSVAPRIAGRPVWSRTALRLVFWSMTLGALGLVIGPWLGGNLWFTVPGLVLHLGATVWLLVASAQALLTGPQGRQPGGWHLITSYAWILAPVLIAPLIIFKVPGFPGAGIEATAPQALVYGWLLQFAFALLPYFSRRFLLHEANPRLGGSWLSLAAVHVGSALIWAGIFLVEVQGWLHGAAYALYALSMVPLGVELASIVQSGLVRLERVDSVAAGTD